MMYMDGIWIHMDPNMVHLVKTCSNMLTSWSAWSPWLARSNRLYLRGVLLQLFVFQSRWGGRKGKRRAAGAATSGYSSKSMGKSAFRYFDRFSLYLFFVKIIMFSIAVFVLVFCFVFSAGVAISFCFSLFVVCSIRNLLLQYIILWVFPFVVVLRPKNHRISQLLMWFSCLNVAGRKRRNSSTTTVLYN